MSSILNMLERAIMPVGNTMYIYGGGWNEADDAGGEETFKEEVSPIWARFARKQNSFYDYRNYDYRQDKSIIHLGLDCSAYVGWVLTGCMPYRKEGWVFKSSEAAKRLSAMGYGGYIERERVSFHRAGDIMSSCCSCCTHVYICVGECQDGSVVFLHSSPPGVQLGGTCRSDGSFYSEAISLAGKYMYRYFPDWTRRFPDISRGMSYLTHYAQLENTFLSDEEGLRRMSCERVLALMFKDMPTT